MEIRATPRKTGGGLRLLHTSVKSRLLFSSVSITFCILLCLAGLSFLTVRDYLRSSLIETTRYKLRIAMANIDRDIDRIVQLVSWCSVTTETTAFISSSDAYPEDRKFKALAAYRSVRDAVYGNGLDAYFDKLIIASLDGRSIQLGLSQGHRSDAQVALAQYRLSGETVDYPYASAGLFETAFTFSSGQLAIPIAKAVRSDDESSRPIGFVFAAVNQEPLARYLADYELEPGSRLFVVPGGSVYGFGPNRRLVPGAAGEAADTIVEAVRRGGESVDARISGTSETIILAVGSRSGWALAQSLPPLGVVREALALAPMLAVIALLFVALVLLLLAAVNRTITRPIELINRRVAIVSTGDFSPDPGIEWDNELGNIGRAINRMSRDIAALIERRLKDEETKKALEFRVLQSQINPHFLYNTLGAVKWMAEIQKAEGIAQMVSSLASLLRHAARGTDDLVPLELELELVREYCTIQRLRSANLFELQTNFADDSLKRCRIVKFTLQPIVENAIMHGIEPKMAGGVVRIEVSKPEPSVVRVDVIDDGVGVAEDRLRTILEEHAQDREAFNCIGLHNVDERLKLAFGADYGLKVESRVGEYTKVSVFLPFTLDETGRGEP
jgi:two-component system sensor histidine kinase YesM